MIIALFPNMTKARSRDLAVGIGKFLTKKGVTVVVEDDEAENMGVLPLSGTPPQEIDYMITLGGDGTILRTIHRHPEIEAPILAINVGSLGFMADIPIDDIYPSLESLLKGEVVVDERLMMVGETTSANKSFAVNEVVLHRAKNPCLIELAIHVDDIYLNTFSADGIIISTPSGSTAYSLAAGGPILTPDLRALALTPICPHTTSNRPIVLMPKREIRIEYISNYEPIEITYDGFTRYDMPTGEALKVSASEKTFKLATLPHHDYFSTLRTKLNWSGRLKV